VVFREQIDRMSAGIECALFRVVADRDIESATAKVFFRRYEDPHWPPHDDLNIGRAPLEAYQEDAEEEQLRTVVTPSRKLRALTFGSNSARSLLRALLIAGWVSPSRVAARVTLRSSKSASNASNTLRSTAAKFSV
jgi:hypothetical protein